jgi:hypothetical protein
MTLHIYSKSTSEAQRVKKRRGLKNYWRCGLEGSLRLFQRQAGPLRRLSGRRRRKGAGQEAFMGGVEGL